MVAAIPRTDWQDPAQPVVGPTRRAPFQQGVVHYEGHGGRDATPADIPRHLRAMQNAYLATRRYSLGYGFAVVSDVRHPDDGTRWEIRGTDLNMASNPGRKWKDDGGIPAGNANDWTGSILLIGPEGVPASEKAAASVRAIFTEWHAEAGTNPVPPFPHNVLDYTSCCGTAYIADLHAGRFDPQTDTQPPQTDPEDDDMAKPEDVYIARPPAGSDPGKPWFVVEKFGGGVRYAMNFDAANPAIEQTVVNAEQYDNLYSSVYGT